MSNGHCIEVFDLTRCPLDDLSGMRLYPTYDEALEGPEPDMRLPGERGRWRDALVYPESLDNWNRRPTGRLAALAEREHSG